MIDKSPLYSTANSHPLRLSKSLLTLLLFSLANSAAAGSLNCRIEPHLQVDVSSPIEGVVAEVLVKKNQYVSKGDVIAKLEASVVEATVDLRRAQAAMDSDIASKQQAYDFSRRNLKRIEEVYRGKAGSFAQFDEARTEKALAAQQLQQARDRKLQSELEYERAARELARRTIVSPIDGIVTERYKEPGEHIDNEPIVQLAQLDPLKVETFSPASLFGKIKLGTKATVIPEIKIQANSYHASVVMVDRFIDAPSHTFGIRLSFPNPESQLPSGLKCKVDFPDHVLPPMQHDFN